MRRGLRKRMTNESENNMAADGDGDGSESMENGLPAQKRRYPLMLLFLVITCCASLFALVSVGVRTVMVDYFSPGEIVGAFIFSAMFSIVTGGIVGAYHFERLKGFFIGGFTGIGLAFLLGPMLLVGSQDALALLVAQFGGALLVVVVATLSLFNQPNA